MAYKDWSEKEIAEYKQVEDERLSGLYNEMELSRFDPESRAKYLVKEFLNLTGMEEEILRGKLSSEGRPVGLKFLEELAAIELANESPIKDLTE